MITTYLIMATIGPILETFLENHKVRAFADEMTTKAVERIEDAVDDMIDEPLAEEVKEMIEAYEKTEPEDMKKALKETADALSVENLYLIQTIINELKVLKGLPIEPPLLSNPNLNKE